MNTLSLLRRFLFVLALLMTGAITIACIQTINQQRPQLRQVGNVFWGFDSLGLILAIWVSARIQSWQSWSSCIRLTMYVLAFGYGGMLFDATQDWWTSNLSTIQLPGLDYKSYGRPMINLLPVLICVLLMQPLFRVFRISLVEIERPPTHRPISILDLFSWTILAAISCVWIRFLNAEYAPLTGYSHATLSQNFNAQITYVIVSIVPTAVLLAQLFAWRRHWLLAVAVLFSGWLADSLVTGFATHLIRTITGTSLGILSGDALDRWCYIAGRSLLGFTFGGLALLFGITIRRTQLKTTEPSDGHQALDRPF